MTERTERSRLPNKNPSSGQGWPADTLEGRVRRCATTSAEDALCMKQVDGRCYYLV